MSDPPIAYDRQHPIASWIVAHRKLVIGIVCAAVLLAAVMLFDAHASRQLDRQIASIRARGEPVSAADLARIMPPVPEDENMTLIVHRHVNGLSAACKQFEQTPVWRLLPILSPASRGRMGRPLNAEQHYSAIAYLTEVADDLAEIHRALGLERGSFNVTWSSPLTAVNWPSFVSFILVSETLALEADVAANEGDRDRAAAVLRDMIRLDRAIAPAGFLLGVMVRMSNMERVQDELANEINLGGMSDAAIEELSNELRCVENSISLKEALEYERAYQIDCCDNLRSSRWRKSPSGAWGGWWSRLPGVPADNYAKSLQIMTEMVEAMKHPDAAGLQQVAAASQKMNSLPRYYFLAKWTTPSLHSTLVVFVQGLAKNRAMRAALACERYRLAHGQWPENLEVLVPEYLEAVLRDPFSDGPIHYRRMPEGIQLWSVELAEDPGNIRQADGHLRHPDVGWAFLDPQLRAGR